MPRPRPPHLQKEISRHGKTVWCVRKGKGKRIRIRAEFGSPEFDEEYQAAVSGQVPIAKQKAARGSLEWLWLLYRQTNAWSGLSLATRRQRENIMKTIIKENGSQLLSKITGKGWHRSSEGAPGPAFPRHHARHVPMGGRGGARQA